MQGFIPMRTIKPGEVAGAATSSFIDIDLNLYGPKRMADEIGKHLGHKQLWLRSPLMVDKGIEVCNPHALQRQNLQRARAAALSASSTGSYQTRTVEEIRSDVLGMFDSLVKSESVPEMEADACVLTPLLKHQKQGLYFMTNREKEHVYDDPKSKSSIWRLRVGNNGQRRYFNVITGKYENTKPQEVLGGILADMMGLGKTLSILALVASTMDDARAWSEMTPPDPKDDEVKLLRNVKTTLLISPLSTIANWEDQIKTHMKPGSLSFYIYHGPNRRNDISELSKYDIVITTYSVVSSEFNRRTKKDGKYALEQTNWFRIVLDEAHMIREQSTLQSKAVCLLQAQRRWAVTGTPVQNRLEDLGALIKFLRIHPFDERGKFAQFILAPFKNADPDILPKLRLLVDSITLRRLKDKIDLPPRHDQIVRLKFSEDEQLLYNWFAKDSRNKARIVTYDRDTTLGGKAYVHILRSILRLRLICAHGRELLSEEDLKMTEGWSQTNAIDLDSDDEEPNKGAMTMKQAYDMLSLLKESGQDNCTICHHQIGAKDASEDTGAKDETIAFLTVCYHIFCPNCFKAFHDAAKEAAGDDSHVNCPLCGQFIRMSFFELSQSKLDEEEEARALARDKPRSAKQMAKYGGPHTKTKALIACLLKSIEESSTLPEGEAPIKR
jgi:SNF2 family DNA or RNA helicase